MGNYNADIAPEENQLRTVAFTYGLADQDDLKVDQFSTLTGNKVFSMVRKIGSTRLQFLVNPDLIMS